MIRDRVYLFDNKGGLPRAGEIIVHRRLVFYISPMHSSLRETEDHVFRQWNELRRSKGDLQ